MRLHLVRHAKAESRSRWAGDDSERPLTSVGEQQAALVAKHLAPDHPQRVLSSPAVRCVQTVTPLADSGGVAIEEIGWLAEGSDPDRALAELVALATEAAVAPAATLAALSPPAVRTIVACTHGDVLWGVLEWLARGGVELGERPDAPKAGIWLLEWDHEIPRPEGALPEGARLDAAQLDGAGAAPMPPPPDRATLHRVRA